MVDILMATYNGEKFIDEQIKSILRQSYNEWKLYIRDDGSTDKTKEIIEYYAVNYPEKIFIIKDDKHGLGAKLNFSELIKYSKHEYCMFSDQDDIWVEDKIEKTLSKMLESERKFGVQTPILIHTDLKVVDEKLNTISNSFWKYQNLNSEYKDINYLLVQNNITGCTMMLNRTLINMSKNIPKECIMHDWWIGLIAGSFGIIEKINEPTILYRQHSNNEVGAHNYASKEFIKNKIKNISNIVESINNSIIQSQKFYEIYGEILSEEKKSLIYRFSNIKDMNFYKRKKYIFKHKIFKQGKIRVLGYIILV